MKLRLSAVAVGALLLAGLSAQAGQPESPEAAKKRTHARFAMFDKDKDQSITLAEAPLTTRSYILGGVKIVEGPDPALFMRSRDKDGDGRVTFAEFEVDAGKFAPTGRVLTPEQYERMVASLPPRP